MLQNKMNEPQNPSVNQGTEEPQAIPQTPVQPEPVPAPQPVMPQPVAPVIPVPAPVAPAPTPIPQPVAPSVQPINLSDNKGMAILAYLGILIIVPFLTGAQNDPYVKFHIKQGLGLIMFWLLLWVLSFVFSMLVALSGIYFFVLAGIVFPLFYLISFILMAVGIVNAATGKTKELPVVGSWGSKFNF